MTSKLDPQELERLSTRQVLEEAWEHLCQTSLSFRRYACTTIPGGDGWTMTGKFCRFLDAEAWTDAALMLVPDGSWFIVKNVMGSQPLTRDLFVADVLAEGDKGRPICLSIPSSHPALAIVQAALRAKEAGDA